MHSLNLIILIALPICNGQGVLKSYESNDPLIQYAWNHSTALNPHHERLLQESIRQRRGFMTGAPEVVNLNMMLIRAISGRKALDVGLYAGFSAMGSALAVSNDGKVIGMDVSDEYWNQIGKRHAEAAGIANKIEIKTGSANATMAQLISQGQSGTFDFCFIDADKPNYDTYYEQCLTLLRPKGIITLDNMLWSGRVLNEDPDPRTQSIKNLNAKISIDTRVHAGLLAIGDGLMVVVKK